MAIVIDIQLQNKSKASQLTKTLNVLKQIREELNAIVGLQSSMGNGWRGAPRGGGGGGSRSIVPKPPSQLQQFRDAFQQFKFYDQLSKRSNGQMGAQGRASALANAQSLAQALAQKGNFSPMNQMLPHVMPKMAQTLGQKIKSAIMTTRVGAGAGGLQVAPLVGRLAALHPAIAVVTGALAGMGLALNRAKDAALGFAGLRATLGGSPQETAAAKSAAASLGLDPNATSQALRDAIQSGAGASYAAQAGINQVGGPFGDNNYSKKLIKALDFIINAPDFDTARRRAEGLGIPDAAAGWYMDPKDKKGFGKSGKPVSPEDIRDQLRYAKAMAEFNSAVDRFNIKVVGPLASGVASMLNGITNVVEVLSVFGKQIGQLIGGLPTLWGQFAAFFERLRDAMGWGSGTKSVKDSLDKNTASNDNLRQSVDKAREVIGGGQRSRGAVPNKLRGEWINGATIQALGAGVRI